MPVNSTGFPIAGPSTSGSTYTVDYYLSNPDVLAADLVDIAREEFWVTSVFDMGLRTDNGAIVVETAVTDVDTDLYPTDDVEMLAPLAEPPLIQGARPDIARYLIETWGAGYPVAEEIRRRNQTRTLTRSQTQLANALTRKMEQRGISELDTALAGASRVTAAAVSSATINAKTYDTKTNNDWILDPFNVAITGTVTAQRGVNYDTALIGPATRLRYGRALGFQNVDAAFASIGLTLRTSVAIADGVGYVCEAGQFGGFGWELDPTVRVGDYDRSIRGYYVDGEAAFRPYIDNVFAAEKLTGL
jgi:hypothetical protein